MRLVLALGILALGACSSSGGAVPDDTDENVMLSDASSADGMLDASSDPNVPDGSSDSDEGVLDGSSDPTRADGSTDPEVMPPDGSLADGGLRSDGGASHEDPDAGPLHPGGRLFVSMEASAPAVWDASNAITHDIAPTFRLEEASLTSGTRGMVLASKRLFIGTPQTSASIVAFDGADTLTSSTPPTAKVPASQLIASSSSWSSWSPDHLTWDARSDSLWVGNQIGIEHLSGAQSISSASSAKALFSHPWHQLPGVAYDATGDRLFLGQISSAGLLAYDGASQASGTPAHSFVLWPSEAAWTMTVDGGRLYALVPGGNGQEAATLAVWNDVSDLSAARAPDFTMGATSGLRGFASYITVQDDVLIACMQSGKVHLWAHASALSGETMPTQTITLDGANSPRKALLGPVSGRLYVLDDEGIAIYARPLTAPALVAKVRSGIVKPFDFAVLE